MGWMDARLALALAAVSRVDSVQYMPYDLSPQTEQVPDDHLDQIEQAIASADAGRLRPLEAVGDELRRRLSRADDARSLPLDRAAFRAEARRRLATDAT